MPPRGYFLELPVILSYSHIARVIRDTSGSFMPSPSAQSATQPQNTIDAPYTSWHDMYMRSHHVTLTEPVSELIESQIASGRFKDFSAAMQEAAWNYFFEKSPFEEYGVTPGQVASRYKRDVAETKRLKRAGKLKPWKA